MCVNLKKLKGMDTDEFKTRILYFCKLAHCSQTQKKICTNSRMEKFHPKSYETVPLIKGEYLSILHPHFGPMSHHYKFREYKILDPSMLKCKELNFNWIYWKLGVFQVDKSFYMKYKNVFINLRNFLIFRI